jgi:hypothetical protein
MKKSFKRIVKITAIAIITAILTIVTIVLFPEHLFANKLSYKCFTVYSNEKMGDAIKIVLDNAIQLVHKSEINDSGYKYNIIVCNHTFYNNLDDKLFGEGPAARSRLNNVIIKVSIDPKSNSAFPTFHKACTINLTELLAHEMTHCLQANKYGITKFSPFKHPEFWKLEGYPEYISRQKQISRKDYNLSNDIDNYIKLKRKAKDIWILEEEGGCEVPDYYYRGRLMIQYLMDIRHLSYTEILNDTTSENTVYQEMITWKESIKKN